MQQILSVDLSTEPAQIVLVGVEGERMEFLSTRQVTLGDLVTRENLLHAALASGNRSVQIGAAPDGQAEAAASFNGPARNGSGWTGPNNLSATGQDEEKVVHSLGKHPLTAKLREVLGSLGGEWTSSILTIPCYEYLSLNLELPFADTRSINKILDLEVQDIIPFEVDEFVLNHRTIAQIGARSEYDVHVGGIPKAMVRNLLLICKASGFEPMIISTPASALGGLYHLAPKYFNEDSAIIYARTPFYSVTTFFDKHLRTDRCFDLLTYAALPRDEGRRALLTDLKLTISSAERRYQRTIERVYLIGDGLNVAELQQQLGRDVQPLEIAEVVPPASDDNGIAGLAAVFAKDTAAPPILTNFRVKEFSFSPQLTELYRGAREILPYIAALVICFVIYLLGLYGIRQLEISRLRSAVRNEIGKLQPPLPNIADGELPALQRELGQLEQQLKDIASLSPLSPLAAFAEIAGDFPERSGVSITSLRIKDNKIEVEGSAPNYSAVDEIEKKLRQKNTIYKRIRKGDTSTSATVSGGRSFSFEIYLTES